MRRLRTFVVWSWPISSCLISGAMGALLRCPNGGFVSYAIPFPMAMGTFHVPALVLTTVLLHVDHAALRRCVSRRVRYILMAMLLLALLAIGVIALNETHRPSLHRPSWHIFVEKLCKESPLFVWWVIDPALALGITFLPWRKAEQFPLKRPNEGAYPDDSR